MKSKSFALENNPIFKQAVANAKAIAQANAVNSLTPLLVLGGLAIIARGEEASPELFLKLEIINQTLDKSKLKLEKIGPENAVEKLPVSDELRKILSSRASSLGELIDALIACIDSPRGIDDPAYLKIIAYASAASISRKLDSITPEVFGASAYIAFVHGTLPARQVLSTFFLNNRLAFEALIQKEKLEITLRPDANQKLIEISKAVIDAIDNKETQNRQLLAVLDLGLKTGQRLVARSATAYHEAGHAIVSALLRPSLVVTEITIKANDNAEGTTYFDPNSPYSEMATSRTSLESDLATALAGRAAQLIKFGSGEIDEGAYSDIENATELAWRSVTRSGLDDEFGPINLDVIAKQQGNAAGYLFDLAQRQVQTLLKMAAVKAEQLLRANWSKVEAIAAELLDRETVNEMEFADKLTEKSLAGNLAAFKARSRTLSRVIRFAPNPGVLETSEGPVRYDAGDPIIADAAGQWVTSRDYVRRFYKPVKGVEFGEDGEYIKDNQDVLVLQLSGVNRLEFPGGKGSLCGKEGDWIVDYGNDQFSIVSKDRFDDLYELKS